MAVAPETEHMLQQGYDVPATYANRFRVQMGLDVTRVAFGEAPSSGTEPHFRFAVMMPTAEARNLGNLLRQLADRLQGQVRATVDAGTHGEMPN